MGGATAQHASQENGFQQWKSKYAPHDSGSDYDLRGAYYAGSKPDMERGHFPDTFKLPNHPTFSTGSKYSTPERMGGEWNQSNGKDTYEPSKWMEADTARMEHLAKYMKRAEPNAVLIRRPLQNEGIKLLPETNIQSVNAYFKQHPEVAGMVTGAGANGMPQNMPAGYQINPYNNDMRDPSNRQVVIANESIRNEMNRIGYAPTFKLPKEQIDWSKTLGAYATNMPALRQTIIARLATGDNVPNATPEEIAEAKKFIIKK